MRVSPHPAAAQPPRRSAPAARLAPVLAAASLLLAACGGGGGAGDSTPPAAAAPVTPPAAAPAVDRPATRLEAARFLAQATFGATEADIDRVMAIGYAPWIDEQLALPATPNVHRLHWEARNTQLAAASAGGRAGQDQVFESFWKQAVTAPDQLRHRVAWAWSQIFVISLVDGSVGNEPRAAAAWLDMLTQQGLGSYRDLLQQVSLHPMMGVYLSHLRNQKADPRSGRVPDENYAREVMQLFSIGVQQLDEDGRVRRGADGQPLETYGPADVTGLARVFTGWSWDCPHWPDNACFLNGSANGDSDPDRTFKPMRGYPQFHSTEEKRFLGAVVPAQGNSPDPAASLRVALDTLAAHPNVGPFISRQLIQRLVTSNPSAAYVRDVARVFADNGRGVRGDLRAVVRAILLHPQAQQARQTPAATGGRVREPVLRLAAFLRAYGHRSDSGHFRVGNTDNAANSLGQTPLRAASVFNFYRPGYIPPGTAAAQQGLAVPEMQIVHETSAAGWVNFVRDAVSSGVGQSNGTIDGTVFNRRDLQPDLAAELALAGDPAALVDRVFARLLLLPPDPALRSEVEGAVSRIAIPAATASNATQVANAQRARVNAALLLTLAAPEFAVQP
jgi:uncharacterized protein (DUF1800 family)